MSINKWMSWEGGVDLVALTSEQVEMPNVIVHVARMVHTPVGSAPSGMILLPNDDGSPKLMAFVSTNETVGNYFASNVFAGTPFENAPAMVATMDFTINMPSTAEVKIKVGGHDIHLKLSDFGLLQRVNRKSPNLPFFDDSLESEAGNVQLLIDGAPLSVIVPPVGMSGGPAAVYAATGFYSR